MEVITTTSDLAAACERLAGCGFVCIDTEFMRETTFWPDLCLIQMAGGEEEIVVDTLAPGLELAPFFELMADSRVLKVFHAARQDIEIIHYLAGIIPYPIFDTQVAAMVCGFGEQVGYDTLARKVTGAKIDKAFRFADWSKRPLGERQLEYALADVTHLRQIYEELHHKLTESGRARWLDEEMANLTNPETYRLDPLSAWQRLKPRSSDRRYLAVLREVAAWREHEAQRRDVPRNRILRDEQIQDIAARRPQSAEQLAQTRGLGRDFARGRAGAGVLKAVERALSRPGDQQPVPTPKQELPQGLGPVVELLKVLLKAKCEAHGVAQKLVATTSELERIAADDKADVAALHGWRYEIFGAEALALKHGRLALSADRQSVRIVPLTAPETTCAATS